MITSLTAGGAGFIGSHFCLLAVPQPRKKYFLLQTGAARNSDV